MTKWPVQKLAQGTTQKQIKSSDVFSLISDIDSRIRDNLSGICITRWMNTHTY